MAARAFHSIAECQAEQVVARLSRDLRVPVALRYLRSEAAAPFEPTPHMVLARFSVGRAAIPVVVEFDNRTALEIVDRLLGGDGTSPLLGAPLSAIQRGLLSYVFLRALDAARPAAGAPLFLSGVSSAAHPGELFLSQPHTRAVWTLNLAGRESLLRAHLPTNSPFPNDSPISSRILAGVPTAAKLEIARLGFDAEELRHFRLGDVILLHSVSPRGRRALIDAWEGEATVAFGRAPIAAFAGRAERAGTPGFWRFAIARIMPHMANESTTAGDSRAQVPAVDDSSTAILHRVPVTLAVEIARVEMTAAAAAALHIGETIMLGRNQDEPVVVTANGAVIGAGELVDVDGELGVRLTRLER
ncbi:MAG: FliM/FliN family flagellar motor switch protein [Deltaproteobacteria bacterium]|nr:FliM/FliN family flagellar motor switch protein [Deltaproteobacteria bacterium]